MISERQILILNLREEGKTHKQISALLGLSYDVVKNESSRAHRTLRSPPKSLERFVSNRTANVLRESFGPGEVTPAKIKEFLSNGTLRWHSGTGVVFKGVKVKKASKKTFLELTAYAELTQAQRLQMNKSRVFPLGTSQA